MKTIYYLEDDSAYAQLVVAKLEREFPLFRRRCEIHRVSTVKGYLELLGEFKQNRKAKPDLIMLDLMVRYADPEPGDPEVPTEWSYESAGLRCAALTLTEFPAIPIVLYSIVEDADISNDPEYLNLRDKIKYVAKGPNLNNLAKEIYALLGE